MNESKRTGVLIAAGIWILIAGALAAAYKYWISPSRQDALVSATGSESHYSDEVIIAADAFSGYAILRSEAMANDLRRGGIRLTVEDDKADYVARIKALKKGKVNMAVFTVDALITASAAISEFPATIVMVLDETVGADAIVAPQGGLQNLQGLDHASARIVATPASPSEFLARTVIATLSLPRLAERWLVEEDGAGAVYQRMKTAGPNEARHAYVLWEPFVTKAVKEQGARILLDSSKMQGYIVDVLVASRRYLQEKPQVVRAVVEAYGRAAYSYGKSDDDRVLLIMKDAAATGAPLKKDEAKAVVAGIRFKNVLENYAHFGVGSGDAAGLDPLEEIIGRIAEVLVRSGALPEDPVAGKAHTLFYRGIMQELLAADYHPAKKVAVLDGIGAGTADLASVRAAAALRALSDAEWKALSTVGSMRVESIAFRRGTAALSSLSESELQALAKKFNSWPSYYMKVVGQTRNVGDADANRKLARARADTVRAFLERSGVAPQRLRVEVANASDDNHASVSFVLGQDPF